MGHYYHSDEVRFQKDDRVRLVNCLDATGDTGAVISHEWDLATGRVSYALRMDKGYCCSMWASKVKGELEKD